MKKSKENYSISSSIRLLWNIADNKDRFIFILLILACGIRALSAMLSPLVTACIIAKLSNETASILFITFPSSMSIQALILTCFGCYFLISATSLSIRALIQLFSAHMNVKTNDYALRLILKYRKNFELPMTNGEANYIIKYAGESVRQFLETFMIRMLVPVITILFTIVYIGLVSVLALAILLVAILFIIGIIIFRITMDKRIFKKIENIDGKINNHLLNNITNLPYIGYAKSKDIELGIQAKYNAQFYKCHKKKNAVYITYWGFSKFVEFATLAGVCLLIIGQNFSIANATSALIVLIPYLTRAFSNIEELAFVVGSCQQQAIKIARLFLLDIDEEEVLVPSIIHTKEKGLVGVQNLPKDQKIDSIQLKNMHLKVGEFERIVQNVRFEKGVISCLMGTSGTGKTTLLNSLLGLKEYEDGQIIVNDRYSIRNLFFENDRVSLSCQGEVLFDRGIVENMIYPNQTLDAKTNECIQYFDMQDIVARDMEGEIQLKNKLSGGEKKRISLIRCLSKNAEVYILDEPTNELDEINVQRVIAKLNELKNQAVVIVISHDARVRQISDNVIEL